MSESVLHKKFALKIFDLVTTSSNISLFSATGISKDRIYAISMGDTPSLEELEKLVTIADIELVELLCQFCREYYPDESEQEIIHYRNLFLSNHLRQKKEEFRYGWDEIKDKFNFNKQDDYRLRQKDGSKISVAKLKLLVGFCDPEILNYIQGSFHDLGVPNLGQLENVATANDLNQIADGLGVDQQINVAVHIIENLNKDEFMQLLELAFSVRNSDSIAHADSDDLIG